MTKPDGRGMAAALLGAAFVLGACSSSGGGGGGAGAGAGGGGGMPATPAAAPTLAQSAVLAAEFAAELDGVGPEADRARELVAAVRSAEDLPRPADPLTGQASYSGSIGLVHQNNDVGLLAALGLTIDFDDGSLTGSMGRAVFDDDDDVIPVDGTADITGTVADNALDATFAGEFTAGPNAARVAGRMQGEMLGTDGQGIAGGASMNARGSGPDSGGVSGSYTGIFALSRD